MDSQENHGSYWKKLWLLFYTFAKIAALVVGGGYAILPVVEETFSRKNKLISSEELLDMMALVQTIPGIIAANSAIYVGMKIAGIGGVLAAVFGVCLPSVTIIVIIAALSARRLYGSARLHYGAHHRNSRKAREKNDSGLVRDHLRCRVPDPRAVQAESDLHHCPFHAAGNSLYALLHIPHQTERGVEMSILSLFWTFFQFGLVSFGGGYVLVPLLIAEFVNRRGIISMDAFGNLVSIAQVTPGPIGINSATYVGFTQGGFWGAVFASLGLVMPSIIIGSAAVYYINKWKEKLLVKGILKGVRSAALAMLFYAVVIFLGMSVFTQEIPFRSLWNLIMFHAPEFPAGFAFSFPAFLICTATVILINKTRLSMTLLIVLSAIAGALICR